MSASTSTTTTTSTSTTFQETPERRAFYESLSPKDRIIHDLAVKMLQTRYTPERCNAWISFKRQLK